MKPEEYVIEKDKFVFADPDRKISDKELATKPVGYFKDALNRFTKNKASIVAFFIIVFLILFALFGPIFTKYTVSYNDARMSYCLPKSKLFSKMGIWDGTSKKDTLQYDFYLNYAIGVETGHNAVKNQEYETYTTLNPAKKEVTHYVYRLDSYYKLGVVYMDLSESEYKQIQAYQNETKKQVIYPMTDEELRPQNIKDENNANYWFKTKDVSGNSAPVLDSNGNYINIYLKNYADDDYNSLRISGDDGTYAYATKNQTGYSVRISYYDYYVYYHSYVLKDGITEPSFLFGSTHSGQDIFTCLAHGARFSFLLAICISVVNLFVGAIYGSIEGYYGGKIDIIMERIVEILSAVPFMVVITLLKYHMGTSSQVLVLFIAFFLTGWIGMASRTRMQFYRFKNQEYVLAARTLGASDARIMFKHIFTNAIGTLITSCVLIIPSTIFSETSLSYLGIINLNTGNLTSIGTLLANAQPYLSSYPYMIVFPAVFICLLMLSFNLFGNGLRDAFNPSLRGSEE